MAPLKSPVLNAVRQKTNASPRAVDALNAAATKIGNRLANIGVQKPPIPVADAAMRAAASAAAGLPPKTPAQRMPLPPQAADRARQAQATNLQRRVGQLRGMGSALRA